jgi:hypothetical protein
MNKDDIIRMAHEAGLTRKYRETDLDVVAHSFTQIERFAALVAAAEREKVAQWMMQRGYATGHGDTTEDLLAELDWQIVENWTRAMVKGVETEREACAKVCDALGDEYADANPADCAAAIRARGQE